MKMIWKILFVLTIVFCIVTGSYKEGLADEIPSVDTIREQLLPGKALTLMGPGGVKSQSPTIDIRIPFEVNQYQVSPTAIPYIQALGSALSDESLSTYVFEIQGHTCNLGSAEHNLKLSEQRAQAVKQYLLENFGFSDEQLHVVAYGETSPKYYNNTEEGRIQNRRVTVVNTLQKFGEASQSLSCKIEVSYLHGSEERILLSNETLMSGTKYAISFIPNQQAYLYVFQEDSSGKLFQLFPDSTQNFSTQTNPVSAGAMYRVPENISDWIFLDEQVGKEQILVLASKNALSDPILSCRQFQDGVGMASMGVGGIVSDDVPQENSDFLGWKILFNHQ